MNKPKFVITGTPRSRTAWLGALLATPECPVYHDIKTYPQSMEGDYAIADPSISAFPALWALAEGVPVVVLHRPVDEVKVSLTRAYGLEMDDRLFAKLIAHHIQFCRSHAAMHVIWSSLDDSVVVQAVARFLTGKELNAKHIETYQALNITQHVRKAVARMPHPKLRLVAGREAATGGPGEGAVGVEPEGLPA